MSRLLAALCALTVWAAFAAASVENRPFTVNLMMQTEGVAEALFEPHGQRLLIERTAAYEASQTFAGERAWSRERATLLSVDLGGRAGVQSISPNEKEHIWLGSYSPSGARAAIGWFDGDAAKSGVYDFATGTLRKFDFLISNGTCAFDCPYWLSEDEFIHYTLSADEQKKQMSDLIYTDELASRWARQTWKGDRAAVKVLGSGRYQSKALEEGGTLLRVDTRTGQAAPLAQGIFGVGGLELAPDRRRFAVIRETGTLPSAGSEVKAIAGSDKILELAVYDFTRSGAKVLPCPQCNITRGSLRWSPGGGKLFFGARVTQGGKQTHEHYIYDFRRARLERFAPQFKPGTVKFETVDDLMEASFVTPFLWMDENTPAVRISSTIKRHDWYAAPPGRTPVKLTEGLNPSQDKKKLEDYVTARDGHMFIMADGEMWQLSADGKRQNLTQSIDEAVSPWCSVISYWREAGARPVCSGLRTDTVVRPIDEQALEQGWLALRTLKDAKDKVPTGDLLFLNIKTGETARLNKPDPHAELVTVSAVAKSALFRRKGEDGDRMLLTGVSGNKQELLHFNRHLAGVAGGSPIMLTRREAGDDEDRIDWLLLPPGHKQGDRHPLLVYFYPDTKYSKEWRSDDLRAVSFLNQHIPAARGYAVLLASMRISTMEERGNPMLEMHEQLVRAAENVVKEGYADSQRWALMGHSYGGYGTNSVITQTNRFKAAVAMAGPVNLTSSYAIGMSTVKVTAVASELAFGAMWSEGGQGRMGVPPWKDPPRYIKNSPLFSADKIQTPLMLVHGDYDFVNVNEAEQMFNALQRQGKDAQLLRYWGEGHIISSPANIRDLWERIFAWFDDHMDIARDANGNILYADHQVKSRAGAPTLKPEDFARFDRL